MPVSQELCEFERYRQRRTLRERNERLMQSSRVQELAAFLGYRVETVAAGLLEAAARDGWTDDAPQRRSS